MKKLKTRNAILLGTFAFVIAYILYKMIFYSIKGWQWDSMDPYVLGVTGLIDVATATVAIFDKKYKKEEDEINAA